MLREESCKKKRKKKTRSVLMIKNNNRHILNMFSAVLDSPVAGNRDNELRRIMKRIGCPGENCEPAEREFSGSFQWEQDSAAGTVPGCWNAPPAPVGWGCLCTDTCTQRDLLQLPLLFLPLEFSSRPRQDLSYNLKN